MISGNRFLAVYALLFAAVVYLATHRDLGVSTERPLSQFPVAVNQWRITGESVLTDEVQSVLKASDVLVRQYANPQGDRVELYIGYHDGAKGGGDIHSPKHCLPGSGWFQAASGTVRIPVSGGELNLVRAVYQKGDARQIFFYWYQVRGESLSDEYALKLTEIANSVLYRRRDAALIRVSVSAGGDELRAQRMGEQFVSDFLPSIRAFLPS